MLYGCGSCSSCEQDVEVDFLALKKRSRRITEILLESSKLKAGQVMVLGCSTSEVQGKSIGSSSNTNIAHAILEGIRQALKGSEIFLAVQCCEHLNRSLVIESEAVEKYDLTQVAVRPVPDAGGAAASVAMEIFDDPVVVESIQAHAGIDIGDTFIGMHIKAVAVPLRFDENRIGHAHVTAVRTRHKLIGGKRAVYE